MVVSKGHRGINTKADIGTEVPVSHENNGSAVWQARLFYVPLRLIQNRIMGSVLLITF